jgi:hypothetical protein
MTHEKSNPSGEPPGTSGQGWSGESLSLPATIRPLLNGLEPTAPDERDRLLIEAHEKIEQMVHAIPSILIGINPQRRIIHWNQISEKTFGVKREEILGQRLDECELPWDRILVLSHIATVLQTKTFLRMEEIGSLLGPPNLARGLMDKAEVEVGRCLDERIAQGLPDGTRLLGAGSRLGGGAALP